MAHALMARYRAGQMSIEAICELEAEALGERTHDEVAAVYARVAERVAASVHDDVRALLRALRARGWSVHVVSGSLGDAVAACMRYAEIPFDTAAGAALVREGGAVRARLAAAVPLFEGKVHALREVGAWPAGLGLGDGGWDVSFLRECALPVLVRPKPTLLDAMAGHPHAVVLA
jgi:phosphoserine phosphatase